MIDLAHPVAIAVLVWLLSQTSALGWAAWRLVARLGRIEVSVARIEGRLHHAPPPPAPPLFRDAA